MIIPVLAFFLLLSSALVVFGYWQKESMYVIVGFSLLFVLGMQGMFEGGLEYQSGYTETVDGNVSTVVYSFTEYDPDWYGFRPFFWIAMLGAFGAFLTLIDYNETFRRYRDED